MRLVLDAEIAVGNRTFPIFLRYPDMFPFSPPSVFPRGDSRAGQTINSAPAASFVLSTARTTGRRT